ncbi:hypothetical protein CF326_g8218, partial [Tilletia indica]
MADPPATPSPPEKGRGSSTDPPDRGGGGGMLTSIMAHPWAVGLKAPDTPRIPRAGQARTQEEAAFTPDQAQTKRLNRGAATAEEGTSDVATGTSTSKDPQGSTRSTRQAAMQASALMTKEAQAKALGLSGSRRAPGALGASLGILPRPTQTDNSPSAPTPLADREVEAMDEDANDNGDASQEDTLPKDKDLEAIKAAQKRQQKKV